MAAFPSQSRVIACDLDDVLAQTNVAICHWHNINYGTSLDLSSFHYYHYWKNPGWGSPNETMNKVRAFYETDAFKELPVVPGAKEGIAALKAKGYNIVVVTARPDSQKPTSELWLAKHFPGLIDRVYYTGEFVRVAGNTIKTTKYSVCQLISAEVLIDDNLNHVLSCAAGSPPIPTVLFGDYEWGRRESSARDSSDVDWMSYEERTKASGEVEWWKKDNVDDLPRTITKCKDWESTVSTVVRI